MISVKVRFFAIAKEITGKNELELSMEENATAQVLLELLIRQYPAFDDWKKYLRFAQNDEYIGMDVLLRNKDEITVIPPVSGG